MTQPAPPPVAEAVDVPSSSKSSPPTTRTFLRWLHNPVWRRELIQSSRLARTPMILMATCIVLTAITCSVGGLASSSVDPAELGSIIYQVFFSLCFAMVCWIGPGVGTLLMTAEHSNRTWDALVLTGLSAPQIVQGKFMAALAYVGQYLVMVAPIGAVPFIAGGVTAVEVGLAYLLLSVFAVLAVGFGVCVGSAIPKAAPAMLVSITSATLVSSVSFVIFGVAAAALAHDVWPGVIAGAPVWLPTAYVQADLGWDSLATLVYVPWCFAGLLAWLFYEVAVANISPTGANRFYRLKRWTLFAYPLLLSLSFVPRFWVSARDEHWMVPAWSMAWILVLGQLLVLLFCGESPQLSRRAEAELARADLPLLRRWLSPEFGRGHTLVLLSSLAALLATCAIAATQELENAAKLGESRDDTIILIVAIAASVMGFLTLGAGVNLSLRARSASALGPRLLTIVANTLVLIGPWLVLAISGLLSGEVESTLWLASPSPLFGLVLIDQVAGGRSLDSGSLWLYLGVSGLWFGVGVATWLLALRMRRSAT